MPPDDPPQNVLASAVGRGLGLGLVFTLVEAAKNLPPTLRFHFAAAWTTTVFVIAFNLALGVAIALLAAPLLKLRRGRLWHPPACLALLAAIFLPVPIPIPTPTVMKPIVLAGIVLLYGLGLVLRRWRWPRRVVPGLGVAMAAAALALPYAYDVDKWTPDAAQPPPPAGAPNVLWIVLDTVRADRLDLMGYDRETFPWLEELAREGATFERALSTAPWTLPSHASMFTGVYPSVHGAHHEHPSLDRSRTTAAEVFWGAGWETVALSSNPWVSKSTGMTRGFAFEEPTWRGFAGLALHFAFQLGAYVGVIEQDHNGRQVTERWLAWLDGRSGERPFFAFLNYVESHFPLHHLPSEYLGAFSPPGVSRRELKRASQAVMDADSAGLRSSPADEERVRELYDAALRYDNDLVSRAVEALRERGVLDRTIVVIVADHGDLLGEHDGMFTHNRGLLEPLLNVPLVIRYPPRVPAGVRIASPVTTAALFPTLLDLAGLEPPPAILTRSFAPLFAGDVAAARSPLLAENFKDPGDTVTGGFKPRNDFDRIGVRYRALEEDGWKLVVDSTGRSWLFHPREDPLESRDLTAEHPEIAARLAARLAALVEAYGLGALDGPPRDAGDVEIDPDVRERLRALGYAG